MPASLEPQWLAARERETRGDLDGARRIYEGVLALDPTQAFAWSRLSAIASRQGRIREAREAALTGTELAQRHRRWRALPWLTQQLLGFDERAAVERAIAGADWNHPLVLSQSAVLAQQLWLADAHATGLRLAEHGLRAAPRSHLLHYVHGNLLRHLGRAGEATAAFERCLALSPGFAEGHWALAYHQPSEPRGARVPRVRAALDAAPDDPLQRAFLGYALFKELDDAGDCESAWPALADAAAAMRGTLKPSREREDATLHAVLEAFGQRQRASAGPASPDHTPVFIVGMPRTGTTLLERILGNHSRVASGGELNAFGTSVSLALDQAYAAPPTAAQARAAAALDPAGLGAAYLERTAHLYGDRSHLLDKNPLNLWNAGLVARALPQARILCLVREPMDACFSNYKELFPGGAYDYSYDLGDLAAHWRRFDALARHWQATLPGRFMTVSDEALVADPAAVAGEVLAFCGLDFEPGCVDITRNEAPVSTASSSQVREPIHRKAVGAWQRYANQLQPLRAALDAATGRG